MESRFTSTNEDMESAKGQMLPAGGETLFSVWWKEKRDSRPEATEVRLCCLDETKARSSALHKEIFESGGFGGSGDTC